MAIGGKPTCSGNERRRRPENVSVAPGLFLLFASALLLLLPKAATAQDGTARPKQAERLFPPADTALACEPEVLAEPDTLTLTMEAPHGGDLGVTGPEGRFRWLVQDRADFGNVLPGSSGDFRALTRLRLPAGEATALPAVHGIEEPKRLFGKEGAYTFHLSEELDTDSGVPVAECEVTYRRRE